MVVLSTSLRSPPPWSKSNVTLFLLYPKTGRSGSLESTRGPSGPCRGNMDRVQEESDGSCCHWLSVRRPKGSGRETTVVELTEGAPGRPDPRGLSSSFVRVGGHGQWRKGKRGRSRVETHTSCFEEGRTEVLFYTECIHRGRLSKQLVSGYPCRP